MEKHIIVSASDFKVHCLEYLEQTRAGSTNYIVTKRGKPIAQLVPIMEENHFAFGKMAGTAVIKGDIISPIDVQWGDDAD